VPAAEKNFDLFVIGTGPAGQRAAVQAAKLGKSVGICERREVVGGVCINTGTIPSKTLREAVLYLTGFQMRGLYGASYAVKERITMEDLLYRCEHVIKKEVDVVRDQMRRNGIVLIGGAARFLDPHRLEVAGSGGAVRVMADKVLIATGTTAARPQGVPIDGQSILTSDDILGLKEVPRTLTVVGAGVVGAEYASIFAALRVEVTLVDRRPRLLEFVDAEIVESLTYQMRNMDCTFRLNEEVASVRLEGPRRAVTVLKSGKLIVSDVILYSVGRVGATADLNLEAAGLAADERGRLNVNEVFQTSRPHIYAAGDVIGFPSLAASSMEQGRLAGCHMFGASCASVPGRYPYGIYTVPEISMIGSTEQELTAAKVAYEFGIARYEELARGQILGDDVGMLKILFDPATLRILGVHAIGESATEIIHIGQAVMSLGGTMAYLRDAVFNYPTLAEAYKVAALNGLNKI